ncbi:YciI family protein [Coralliovum pocilloporae]|uniref:YciI family protein n=1 Tax=Coralliovum pocilloporae TaxID=3066369 RepID=UPI0033072225
MAANPKHFVVELTYKVPTDALEPAMASHVAQLKDGARDGIVLAFGGKTSGDGGIVILRCNSIDDAQQFVDADPFVAQDLVSATITGFNASFWQDIPG